MTNPPEERNDRSDHPNMDDLEDNPNFKDLDLLRKFEKLQELPPGWSHNHDLRGDVKAPYVHISGKQSFRHPNRPQMDALVQQIQNDQKKQAAENIDPVSSQINPALRSKIKKLRMMLQFGIPPSAVEQKAKLDGVDMKLVLGEDADPSDAPKASAPLTFPAPLLKKYKRMLKSGVPMRGIQTQARIDGGWTPEQVEEALNDAMKPSSKVEQEARDVASSEGPAYVAHKTNVSFPAKSMLGFLVRKMAQTVHKSVRFNKDTELTVDNETLYNALGALKGVQVARDQYNTTCTFQGNNDPRSIIQAKRQAFGEIARNIGMELPKNLRSTVDILGLDDLIRYIERKFSKELAELKGLFKEGWYDFETLPALYPPGSRVVAKNAGGGGVDMICQVLWNRFEQGRTIMGQPMKYFKVCFQFIVAVGSSNATFAEVVEGIEYFEGRRSIRSALTFVPLSTYGEDEQESILNIYRRRGETYNKVALSGKHAYVSYDKGSFFLKRGGSNSQGDGNLATALATPGRIIVDTQGAYDNGHSLGVGYDPMVMGIKYKLKEYSLHVRSTKKSNQAGNSTIAKDSILGVDMVVFEKVPDEWLEFVWPCVVGFSLTAKGWGDVLVDGLEDIQWQEDIFDRLVLPPSRKAMVKALVRHSTSSFQDLVQGKGEGTVFLMYGPPGVGKTLTAEAIAELLHKPLYSLSLGTLGTTARELELHLGQIMNMAAKWDALILLDEADCFLETRSSRSSLERNAMVSVMLKLVEYFSGILFLTSNRIDSLDPAFQTRITLALHYEKLDAEARAKVWQNLLVKSGFEAQLQNGKFKPKQLAKASLNGREIKNALRLAMAMAAEKGEEISQATLVETVEIVNDYKATMARADPYAVEADVKPSGCFFNWCK